MDGGWIEDCMVLVLDNFRKVSSRGMCPINSTSDEKWKDNWMREISRVVTQCLFEKWLVAEFVAYSGCVRHCCQTGDKSPVETGLLFAQTGRSRL